MADAREDRVHDERDVLSAYWWSTACFSTAMHNSWLQFAHSCLQTTVDHPSPTAYQRNMQLIPTYIVREGYIL